jgi:hypothetical protein
MTGEGTMRRIGYLALMAVMAIPGAFGAKSTEQATLKDLQPTNFAVAKKKHQQYDFTVATASRSYSCRTPEDKKINATDFLVGSTITFTSSGRNGEVITPQNKKAKCMITRVEALPSGQP